MRRVYPHTRRRPTRRCSGRTGRSLRSLSRSPLNGSIAIRPLAFPSSEQLRSAERIHRLVLLPPFLGCPFLADGGLHRAHQKSLVALRRRHRDRSFAVTGLPADRDGAGRFDLLCAGRWDHRLVDRSVDSGHTYRQELVASRTRRRHRHRRVHIDETVGRQASPDLSDLATRARFVIACRALRRRLCGRLHHVIRRADRGWLHQRPWIVWHGAIGGRIHGRGDGHVCRRHRHRNAAVATHLSERRFLMSLTFAVALGIAMGIVFGFALEKSRVFEPGMIVGQMQLRNFIMLKVFLTAVATGAIALAVLNGLGYVKLQPRAAAWAANAVGGLLLGAGISLTGACPGTTLAQIGAGYRDAWGNLIGGLLGAVSFLYAQPAIDKTFLAQSGSRLVFTDLVGVPYWMGALVLAAACVVVLVVLERWSSWRNDMGNDVDGDLPTRTAK